MKRREGPDRRFQGAIGPVEKAAGRGLKKKKWKGGEGDGGKEGKEASNNSKQWRWGAGGRLGKDYTRPLLEISTSCIYAWGG